jgi:hypothetical protein
VSGPWKRLRYIDLERWAGVGILVWVPRTRTMFSAYVDHLGVCRAWVQADLRSDPVIEGATKWRPMPPPPAREFKR